jgi:hypothetical protein
MAIVKPAALFAILGVACTLLVMMLWANRGRGPALTRYIPGWVWILAAPVAVGLVLAFLRAALQ